MPMEVKAGMWGFRGFRRVPSGRGYGFECDSDEDEDDHCSD